MDERMEGRRRSELDVGTGAAAFQRCTSHICTRHAEHRQPPATRPLQRPRASAPTPRRPPRTIMKVSEEPRNWMLTQGATPTSSAPPKSSIQRKSAGRLRNDPSSRLLLYLTRKNMWKKKSRPRFPK